MTEEAAALTRLARRRIEAGDYEKAASACDQAADVLRELGDQHGLCEVLITQSLALSELGLSEEALDALDAAQQIATSLDDRGLLYWVLNRVAVVHSGLQDFERAHEFQLRALVLAEALDDEARFSILNNLSDNAVGLFRLLQAEGDDAAANQVLKDGIGYADSALAVALNAGDSYRAGVALDNSGMLRGLAGDYPVARVELEAAHRLALEGGYAANELTALHHQASVELLSGRAADAVRGLTLALQRAVELGQRPVQVAVLADLADAYELSGDFESALRRHREFVLLERQLRSTAAATRARRLIQRVDLQSARSDVAAARTESQLAQARSQELEDEKRVLERRTRELDRRVNEDALTRLSNRHHLDAELPRLFSESYVRGRPLAVVILDIDHFKHVNDTFGHAVGDTVLVRVATMLREIRHGSGLVGRLGGEEFLLAFPGLDEPAAVDVSQQIRRRIAAEDWGSVRPGLRVTVSLGVCARSDESDVDELVERADAAMYRAKRAGRNRVERHAGR